MFVYVIFQGESNPEDSMYISIPICHLECPDIIQGYNTNVKRSRVPILNE